MRVGLSSPHGLDVSVLLEVLSGLGADVEVYASALSAGIHFDAAIAVLTGESPTATTAFEIGHAVGQDTPVLLLQLGAVAAPFTFANLPIVRATLDDRETLRLHLRLFLQASALQPSEVSPSARPIGLPWALARLEELRRKGPHDRGYQFESFVARLLADAGAEVEQARVLASGDEIDMVAAIPGYERQLGAVLIEVKVGKPTFRTIDAAQRQLQEHVLSSRAGLGVVVFDDGQGMPEAVQVTPRVVVIGIEQLLTELQKVPLANLLLSLRNEAAHAL